MMMENRGVGKTLMLGGGDRTIGAENPGVWAYGNTPVRVARLPILN